MGTAKSPQFDHRDRQRIYEYVERRGTVDPEVARSELLPADGRGFRHHVSMLRRDGYLTLTDGGDLSVARKDAGREVFTENGLAFAVRPARQEDLTGLVGAIRRIAERSDHVVAEAVARELEREDALVGHSAIESRRFFVATVNEEIVGWVHVRASELAKLRHTAELTVGVLPEYRGHGVGSRLLDRGVSWAADAGHEKVYQSVPATNETAIDFLDARGWETEAIREDHYRIDGEYVDEVMLAVEL
ncbi:L-amino acid N-acyltransferase YncA [Natronoarchaeum philippinense]|uniref:L-amino acid N-acyltransferase YncA n=1 Tax=Natronoarchaeum philippinense TaxID=558529 RepID=A0A285NTH0_NATPI|nr:GNAT family N-acetyltransferase [Natronoarchaeum philippinense]SNZ12790.1 L-amino acid N-acyltransferase YncA [Natronoarchaeum philippinense]